MIESSFTCPSVWESDLRDYDECLPDIPSLFDEFPETGSVHLSLCSNDFSSSSDDLNLNELDLHVTEEFVSEILQEGIVGFSDLDWLHHESPKKSSLASNLNTSNPGPSKFTEGKPSEHLQSSKLWSEMSEMEQVETLHELSETVTYHMCIRQQMEVIKIIDPSAIISPDDKEFALDSTFLDDMKLERIKNILKKPTRFKKSSKSMNTFSSIVGSKKVNNSSKLLSRKSNNLPYSRTKRKQKKQDILYPTEDKQLKLKREKQSKKEQKSGFFVYEKKMKLLNPQEDEDVNILE